MENMTLNKWIFMSDVPSSIFGSDAPAQSAIGYMYVDHECGITMALACLCEEDNGLLRIVGEQFMVPGGKSILLRYESLDLDRIRVLTDEEVGKLGLSLPSYWKEIYKIDKYEWIVQDTRLDPFRAPGYPHDVYMLLLGQEGNEQIWGRLEQRLDQQRFIATLLNEPEQQEFGLHIHDVVGILLVEKSDISALVIVDKLN